MSTIDVKSLTLNDMRRLLGYFFTQNPRGPELWDLLSGCVRGPDTPTEYEGCPCYDQAYQNRRKRKRKGVEILRHVAFYGMVGGQARHQDGDTVELLNGSDHHDRHIERAAHILGLKVVRATDKKEKAK